MFPGTFSDEQVELRSVVRALLEKHSTEAEVRRLMATEEGFDRVLWRRMAVEAGLQGLAVPEEHGGGGFGYVELGIVFEEMGRALLCAPFLASAALATEVLLRCGDGTARKDLLPSIVAGETVATLALVDDGDAVHAHPRGGGWTVTGTKTYVLDGHIADLVIVTARSGAGLSLFVVDAMASGLTRTWLPTLDQTRKQARLDFDAAPARLVGVEGDAAPIVEGVLATGTILLAAEQVGGASKTLELAVEYAKLRVQYGRPIGSFQGIKHLCADLLTEVESARSALYDALWSLAAGSADVPIAAAVARICASEAYTKAAGDCVQVHGGIGFTWEHPAHLHFKRAKSSELLFGTPAHHRERLAVRLGM